MSSPHRLISIHGLLVKLDALEKELGRFIREAFREANFAHRARVGSLDSDARCDLRDDRGCDRASWTRSFFTRWRGASDREVRRRPRA